MKKLKLLILNQTQYWLSFLIPILVLGLVLAHFGIYPFGSKSIMVQDMYNQYIQFYNYYYDVFHHGKSLLYSWEAGMGMNFFGVFGYYLSSFFSIIVLFFSRSHLPEALVVLVLLKIGCSGLAMSIYLKKVFNTKVTSNVIFAVLYALMSYSIVYFQNIMWLDGVIFLPIILLGIEYLLQYNRFGLFSLVLAVSFVSNFYISYMVGIFTFLYFLYRFSIYYDWKDIKIVFKKFVYFAMATLVAVGMSAVVLIPTFYALLQGSSSAHFLMKFSNFSFPLLNLGSQLFHGVYSGLKYQGLPNIFVGILPLLLIPLYFVKKEVSKKEKIMTGLFFIVLILSFEIPFLNRVWHALDRPTFFPFRYSFVFSFLMLMVSARVYSLLNKYDSRILTKTYGILVFFVILLQSVSSGINGTNILYNLILLSVFFVLLYVKITSNNKQGLINMLILLFVIGGMATNASAQLKSLNHQMKFIRRKAYTDHYHYFGAFQQVQNKDKGFYRMQTTLGGSYDDPFQFRYKGIEHFSSLMDLNLVQSLNDLGYTTLNGKWVNNNGGTLVTNSLLDFKYMLSTENKYRHYYGYEKVNHFSNMNTYLNQFALPVGFLTDGVIQSVKGGQDNPFIIQNRLLNDMYKPDGNKKVDYFKQLVFKKIQYKNVSVTNKNGKEKIMSNGKNASITYNFNLKNRQQFYMLLNTNARYKSQIFVNGTLLGTYPETYNYRILNLGAFHNEKVKVRLKINTAQMTVKKPLFYGLNIQKFSKAIHYLKKDPFVVDHWTSRKLIGHIDAKRQGILFLSVPYDKGWTIRVDGKTVQPKKVLGSFMTLNMEKGKHKIEMSYIPPGFKLGAMLSAASVLVFILLLILNRVRRRVKY